MTIIKEAEKKIRTKNRSLIFDYLMKNYKELDNDEIVSIYLSNDT